MMLTKIKSACKIAKFPKHIKISHPIFKTHSQKIVPMAVKNTDVPTHKKRSPNNHLALACPRARTPH